MYLLIFKVHNFKSQININSKFSSAIILHGRINILFYGSTEVSLNTVVLVNYNVTFLNGRELLLRESSYRAPSHNDWSIVLSKKTYKSFLHETEGWSIHFNVFAS